MKNILQRCTLLVVTGLLFVQAVPALATTTMTQATKLSITGHLYLWKDNVITKIITATGKTASKISFPYTGTVKAVAFDDVARLIGYVTTSTGNVDTLKIRKQGLQYFTTLNTADHHFTGMSEVKSSSFRNTRFLTDHTLVTSHYYWEGCSDELYRYGSRTKLLNPNCSSVLASPSGKKYMRYGSDGLASSAGLDFATTLSDKSFVPVVWSKVTGDVSLIYNVAKKEWTGNGVTAATFLDDNTVAVATNKSNNGTGSFVLKYSMLKKTITKIATVDGQMFQMIKAGSWLVGVNGGTKLTRIKISTGAKEDLTIAIPTGSQPSLTLLGVAGNAVVVHVQADYSTAKQRYLTDKIIAVDPASGKYLDLGDGTTTLYAGAAH